MTEDKLRLLNKQLQQMHKAAERLNWSLQRCLPLANSQLSAEDEEKFETLTARFTRMSDILIQKLFRLIDELDLESSGKYSCPGITFHTHTAGNTQAHRTVY